MPTRAAILFDDARDGHVALTGALTQLHAVTEVRHGRCGAVGGAWWLATYRPGIVIASADDGNAVLAAAYRALWPGTRLLVRLREPLRRNGVVRRALRGFVLRWADAVLTEDARNGCGHGNVVPLAGTPDLDAFLACPLPRPPGSVHRFVYVGPLSPRSGATDILQCIAAWAREHRDHPIEIWWAGDGDLAGILDAQPLPAGMTQRFLGPLDRAGLADCFAQCGILLLPGDGEVRGSAAEGAPVAEALAAGLVVVGSQADAAVRRFVVDGVNGWVLDPRRPDQLACAVNLALGANSDDLAAMRVAGRERVKRLAAQTDTDRLHAALSLALPPVPAAVPQRLGLATLQRQAASGTPGAR